MPFRFTLWQSEPNPAAGAATIRYDLPASGTVELEVFDLQGRQVRTLARRWRAASCHVVAGDGCKAARRRVAGGVYLYRLKAGALRAQRRMVILP